MELDVRRLYKNFGDKKVLDGVDFRVMSGKALGLLGRNGAGKTTTIRIIMGVFPPDSGQITLGGKPLDKSRLKLGYLPEEHGLYPKKQIGEQLCYLAQLRGINTGDAKKSIAFWMERLGMEKYKAKRLDTLSKGNQQKIQLAACLVSNPDFIILDEPFSGLDPVNASLLKGVVRDLIGEGKMVLFSSHQMNYVEEFCDTMAILSGGRIVLSGGIAEIKRGYERDKIFIKSPETHKISSYCSEKARDMVSLASSEKDGILVKLKNPSLKQLFFKFMSEGGFDIDAISVREPTLEDIFVEYTAGSAPEQEAVE